MIVASEVQIRKHGTMLALAVRLRVEENEIGTRFQKQVEGTKKRSYLYYRHEMWSYSMESQIATFTGLLAHGLLTVLVDFKSSP